MGSVGPGTGAGRVPHRGPVAGSPHLRISCCRPPCVGVSRLRRFWYLGCAIRAIAQIKLLTRDCNGDHASGCRPQPIADRASTPRSGLSRRCRGSPSRSRRCDRAASGSPVPHAMSLGSLDQHAPRQHIAGLGDPAVAYAAAGGILGKARAPGYAIGCRAWRSNESRKLRLRGSLRPPARPLVDKI